MKKKIMYVTQSNGGVARYLKMIFKNIDRDKFEHILIYPLEYFHEKDMFDNLVDEIVPIQIEREINFKSDFKACVELSSIIKKYNPDLVYLHSSKAGAIGRIVNILYRRKVIYNPHGWSFNMECSSLKKLMYLLIEKFLSFFCDKIVVISNKEKEDALKYNINNVELIINGIDFTEVSANRQDISKIKEKLSISEGRIVIGMVGRISRQKSPDIFIEVAAKIKKIFPNAFFIIVGDGEDRTQIESKIKELDLIQDFHITGWVEDAYPYIQCFDIAMLLSRWEGFGLVLAEYMICEKPIIATNIDAIPGIIRDQENGLLVPVDDVDQIVKAAISLIENKELKNYLIVNALEDVKRNFDINRVVNQHEELFEKFLV